MRFMVLAALLSLLAPGVARAEWLEASSAHFVVYADDSEKDIRRFAEQLERYHSAMALITNANPPEPSPSNRVTVYVVSGQREVRDLYGEGSRYIGGFYIPRPGGSLAIVPRIDSGGRRPTFSLFTLLHEYAHHFMYSTSNFMMPRWFAEGSAEFMASASFDPDGTVEIGRPDQHRAAELLIPGAARYVSVEDVLDPVVYDQRKSSAYDSFYGKSWLLYHYLAFDKEREGQLAKYIHLLTEGKGLREAALGAFGDFDDLEHDLHVYLSRSRMRMLRLGPKLLSTGPIAIRPLTEGEAAVMPVRVRSKRGVDAEQAKEILVDAREVASRYPDDPAVLTELAEAEHDAGNDRESIRAANAALALDPRQVNAYVQKGMSLFRLAGAAPEWQRAAAFDAALSPFLKLNRLENDHPLPLIYNYFIHVEKDGKPNAKALQGLERAAELAPFALGLRMNLAMQELRLGESKRATANLRPVAYNPHGGALAERARQALARLDANPTWDGSDMTGGDQVGQPSSDGADRFIRTAP